MERNMAVSGAEADITTIEVDNINSLNSMFDFLNSDKISNIIQTITYDRESQKIIVKLQNIVSDSLKQEADEINRGHTSSTAPDSSYFVKLSEKYKDKYPKLLNSFKTWKTCREKLIATLIKDAGKLERNSVYLWGFRILTSVADIIGTLAKTKGISLAGSWSDFAMEYASVLGILAMFLKTKLDQEMFENVNKAMDSDKDLFKEILQWFKQSEELDKVITNLFPHGIDSKIVQEMERCSQDVKDSNKIFMSIFVSNVTKDFQLFKNKDFLDKAEKVSSSEIGKHWFHRVIVENDPYLKHRLNSELCKEIQERMDSIKGELSPTVSKELGMELCKLTEMKIFLNAYTIWEALTRPRDRPKASDHFEKLAKIMKEEFTKMTDIVRALKPPEMKTEN